MDQVEPYIACVAGACALYLLLRPSHAWLKVVGALLGLGTLAWLVDLTNQVGLGEVDPGREVLFLFGTIHGVVCSRMITTAGPSIRRCTSSWSMLSSAGLLLLLEASSWPLP